MSPGKPDEDRYFCDIENRQAKEVTKGVRIRTFWGSRMLVAVVDLAANAVVPVHAHPQEQIGTVISGKLGLTIAGELRWLVRGDTYVIPGGIEHGAVTGQQATKVIDVFSPVREDYQY